MLTTLFIPENSYGIPEGDVTRNQFTALMRQRKSEPEVVQFLADMLEE